MGELYNIIHKKYYIVLLLLLLIPLMFGAGCFFNLPYMNEGEAFAGSALEYCAEMQQLIKNLYFLAVIFIACDAFAGELEEGQLRTALVQVCSRRKLVIRRYLSLCALVTVFHFFFWGINMIVYCLCTAKKHTPIFISNRSGGTYIGIWGGYLEAFFICMAVALCVGLFLRKIYSIVVVYILWFALRYVDKVISLKNILTEFSADYFMDHVRAVSIKDLHVYMLNGLVCIVIVWIGMCIFQHKDII